ncbi:MAG: glutamate synthase-related protein [Methanopyri archaeon]|jgi:isopentenyl diphosphate isomerase/L-lactate dehydrogenase-like FMN-dependent dehydrogenase|nr:glutamate synthase-related protein [Methanopyri archaeon]
MIESYLDPEEIHHKEKDHGERYERIKHMAETGETPFPKYGSHPWSSRKGYPGLDDIQIMPRLFGGHDKRVELGRDPIYTDVDTATEIGGLTSYMPATVCALGSTKVANGVADQIVVAAARQGVPYVIGENVMVTHGEDRLKELIDLYHANQMTGYGGILVEGNENEIALGIFDKAAAYGADGIEIKLGQGAKPGLGGIVRLTEVAEAERYRKLGYHVEDMGDGTWIRHSAAGAPSVEGLIDQVKVLKETYDIPVWAKLGGFTDVHEIVYALAEAGVDNITVDGSEGGTGMAPTDVMNEVGLPTLALLRKTRSELDAYAEEFPDAEDDLPTLIIAGGIYKGSQVVKSLALGADAAGMGRPWINAARFNGEEGVENYGGALLQEIQMSTLTTKRYDTADLDRSDVRALTVETSRVADLPLIGEDE